MTKSEIEQELHRRILVLDGAMGTMLQEYDFSEEDFRGADFAHWERPLKGNNDLLSLTQPQAIKEIHTAYLEAGADIIETNTFSATSIAQADYGLEEWAYQLNLRSAEIAREVCDAYTLKDSLRPRWVAGSVGPTNRTASMSPDVNRPGYRAVNFQDLKEAYRTQVSGLMDGGADLLLVETVFDTLNAKAALFAASEVFLERKRELPLMVSGTITDASGRTLSGQTVEAFLISVSHLPLLSIGLNCALGASQLTPYLQTLAQRSPFPISAHPNAGLPNAFGGYDQTPRQMQEELRVYVEQGLVNILGGCCGTTPEHIRLIRELIEAAPPRVLPEEFRNTAGQ